MKAVPRRRHPLTFREESKQSSTLIWKQTQIYKNQIFNRWNLNYLSGFDQFGLYWDSVDFPDIHRLFKVPYDTLMHLYYSLSKEMNFSYNDINNMPFFEILDIIDVFKEEMKEQQEQNELQNKQMNSQMADMKRQYNYNDMMKQHNNSMQNYNNMTNNFKPNFNIPKFN